MPMTREECIDIYRRYSRKLFNVSLRIVGDSGEAEEIMQDTVLKFFRQEMEGQDRKEGVWQEGKMAAWLIRTCVRASIDAVRRRKRERMFFEEYEAVGKEEYSESVEDDQAGANSGMGIQRIKDAIRELPDSYRISPNKKRSLILAVSDLKKSVISQKLVTGSLIFLEVTGQRRGCG